MPNRDTCSSCQFFQPRADMPDFGSCRIRAAQFNATDSAFPPISAIDWCAEHQPVGSPKSESDLRRAATHLLGALASQSYPISIDTAKDELREVLGS